MQNSPNHRASMLGGIGGRERASDGQPPSTIETRQKRDNGDTPDKSSDEFANYALRLGEQVPLTAEQLNQARWGVVRSVQNSHSMLADPYTADTIGNTILEALNRSPAFRAAVSYGVNHGGERLENLSYTNVYEHTDHPQSEERNISEMSLDYLQRFDAQHMPIEADSFAGMRNPDHSPQVNIGMPPGQDSPQLAGWRRELIHEIIHQLTDSGDPPEEQAYGRAGPTELLANRVAQEAGWAAPVFNSYGSPERNHYLEQGDRDALLDGARRNANHEQQFFERLGMISGDDHASPDFYELEDAPANGTAHNHTYTLPAQQPQVDLGQMQFRLGEPSLFSFAHSASSGAPTGFQSARAAMGAGWETQGRFFQNGTPVGGNPHVRAFGFPDGSKVVISAHEPQLASSDLSKLEQGATVVGGAAGGATIGTAIAGPVGLVGGAIGGTAVGAGIASTYPYDRIWQGYSLDYYDKGAIKPAYTGYMYAWDSDWSRVGKLSKQNDATLWPDYADGSPDANWNWWKWQSGSAPVRT